MRTSKLPHLAACLAVTGALAAGCSGGAPEPEANESNESGVGAIAIAVPIAQASLADEAALAVYGAAVACTASLVCVAVVATSVVVGSALYFRYVHAEDRAIAPPSQLRYVSFDMGWLTHAPTCPYVSVNALSYLNHRYNVCLVGGGGLGCRTRTLAEARVIARCERYASGGCASDSYLASHSGDVAAEETKVRAEEGARRSECPGSTPPRPDAASRARLNEEKLDTTVRQIKRTKRLSGSSPIKANWILECPSDLVGPFLSALREKLVAEDLVSYFTRWTFGAESNKFTDFVDKVKDTASRAGECADDEMTANVIEAEDPASAERLSNARDATDRLQAFNIYVAKDAAILKAFVLHANLYSTVTNRISCL